MPPIRTGRGVIIVDEDGLQTGTRDNPVRNKNFFQEVAEGEFSKYFSENILGENPVLPTTEADLWDGGTAYVYPTAASVMTLSSDSASDTAAGIGARTVLVEGLDAAYLEVSETVTLAGLTGVSTVNSYIRVHKIKVLTTGTSLANVGNIYMGTGVITLGVPAVIYGKIIIGNNVSLMGLRTVPANKTGFLHRIFFSLPDIDDTTLWLKLRLFGGIFFTEFKIIFKKEFFEKVYTVPLVIQPKTDIAVRGAIIAGVGSALSGIDLILEK